MASRQNYTNWQLDTDDDNIAWLRLDRADAGTNVLTAEILDELDAMLDTLTESPPRGAVILSAKPNGFIAGADVTAFTSLSDEKEALALIERGQSVMNKLETLPCPTVALIHGFCLGGGLELALACRYRIAEDGPRTRLGLPEVRLGIHPGFGGTLRMVRRVGAPAAMDAMLTGRTLSARAARKIGLVEYTVPERHLHNAARSVLLAPPAPRQPAWYLRLASHRLLRPLLAKYLVRNVTRRAPRAHYPAPYALIELWREHYDDPKRMLAEEAASVARLIVGKTAQNLVRVFLLQERLKALGKPERKSGGETDAQSNGLNPRHVHVIGAGVMGGDIAAWCALQGLQVTVQDNRKETLARVVQRAHELYTKRLKDRRLVRAALDRLVPDIKGNGLSRADVIIEAIFEDVEAKQNLFRSIEPKVRDDALLATNTSSIPLEELGRALRRPERLVGLHFFNPVARMQLVEVVHGPATDAGVSQRAAAFTRQIDRLPLPVTSTPGFLVNRILMPYLLEAVTLAEEGVPLAVIDKAAVDFGMPMGPIELADTVGLDVCLSVAKMLSADEDAVPQRLRTLVESGRTGKKSGGGFYQFKQGKPVKPALPKGYSAPTDLQERLVLRLLNESVACLRDGVVADADLVDAGVVYGTGFAPFRGGPLHYLHSRGSVQLEKTLSGLKQRHGERFAADPGWRDLHAAEH
ncbi:MAG TPA: 3-hydroxyacyl-CoA dehydrogenase NAD-binding domain-containing protein [Gammaproteobacteria bacterium]|nr:3-hydroxyacyl-CoA dehydrogenase NAD-binding domain-containing protein [Gammaproteobacteria bacterium]